MPRILSLLALMLISMQASATAILILSPGADGGTKIQFSGSGTVDTLAGNPGAVLNFNNFTGNPFDMSLATTGGASPDIFGGTLSFTLDGVDQFSDIRFDNDVGADDIDLSLLASASNGSLWEASGMHEVPAGILAFADLNPGIFISNSTDSLAFGGAELRVVPLPAAAWFFITAIGGLISAKKLRAA